jgi:hypothetical protein
MKAAERRINYHDWLIWICSGIGLTVHTALAYEPLVAQIIPGSGRQNTAGSISLPSSEPPTVSVVLLQFSPWLPYLFSAVLSASQFRR